MNPPRANHAYAFKAGRLDELMKSGMEVDDAIAILKSEHVGSVISHEDTDPQDEAGAFDYQKAEEQHRKEHQGIDPRLRPAALERPGLRKAEDRGKRLFSRKTSIMVPEKIVYPKMHFLCKQLGLAAGPPALLIGISQSGKTFFAQDLGLSVATGKPLLGTMSVSKGPVVHIDYEQGEEISRVRYLRLMRGMGLTPSELPPGALDFYREVKKLDDPGAEEELREMLSGKALCIIDSLRASISGEKDENSSGIRETIDMLGAVSEDTGCSVVILHHQGKGKYSDERFAGRGSSAIFEAAGAAYQLDVSGEYPEKVYHLKQTKTRMGVPKEVRYRLEDVGAQVEEIGCSEGIVLVPSLAAKKLSVEEKIMAALRDKGALLADALSKEVGGRKADVIAARDRLVVDGSIEKRGDVYMLGDGGSWGQAEDA